MRKKQGFQNVHNMTISTFFYCCFFVWGRSNKSSPFSRDREGAVMVSIRKLVLKYYFREPTTIGFQIVHLH